MAAAAFLAALSGFLFLGFELLWFRLFTFASGSDPVIFGLVLSLYLAGLASGSLLGGRLLRKPGSGWPQAARLLLLSSLASFAVIPGTAALAGRYLSGWRPGLGLLFAATLTSGGILAALVQAGRAGKEKAGWSTGIIYAANTLGSVAGTIATGYLLLDTFPLPLLNTLFALLLLGAAALAQLLNRQPREGASRAGVLFTALALAWAGTLLFLSPSLHRGLYERLYYSVHWRTNPPFPQVVESRHGVVCRTSDGTILGNGVYDGHLSTALVAKKNREIDHAYLALLAQPDAEKVLEIGLAGGAWARVLAGFPAVKTVTSVEINRSYLELIEQDRESRSLLTNPKVHIAIDDGRRWLRTHPEERFDLIVMNTTFHDRNHATNLLSREFLELVKAHLAPGGVVYLNTTGSDESLKTAALVFPFLKTRSVYCIASLSPFRFDRERFAADLRALRVNGRSPFPALPGELDDISRGGTPQSPGGRAFARISRIRFASSRRQILESLEGLPAITDDNMITEFPPLHR